MNHRIARAFDCASALIDIPWTPGTRAKARYRQYFAIGDLQAQADELFAILDHNGLLGNDGFLLPDVGLVSIGDHFDFSGPPVHVARDHGRRILRWLAEHAPSQVVILLGNHDAVRVMELAGESDASFAAARDLASRIRISRERGDHAGATALAHEFAAAYPRIPTPDTVLRDFACFSEAQRSLVQALLCGGRMSLAFAAELEEGTPILLTHAGVTSRELKRLGQAEDAPPHEIAERLNAHLAAAVDAVRDAWERDARVPLDLEPIHHMGRQAREGGGLLYHRPANPDSRARRGADLTWEFAPESPRRFDPRTLPQGLVQGCGHTSHRKCASELGPWLADSEYVQPGSVRTLCVKGQSVTYVASVLPAQEGAAVLYMLEAHMHGIPPDFYELLPLSG